MNDFLTVLGADGVRRPENDELWEKLKNESPDDLQDIPKRITTWHNVYYDWIGPQCSTRSDADMGDHSGDYLTEERFCVYRIERDEDGGNFEMFREEV